MKTIYELLSNYSETEIDIMIKELSEEDKKLISLMNGNNLHNPQKHKECTQEQTNLYYYDLVPRMQKKLEEKRIFKISENHKSRIETYDPLTAKLLELINQNKSNREICEKLGIDSRQLSEALLHLRNSGIKISQKYYYDGTTRYSAIVGSSARSTSILKNNVNKRTLITDPQENELRFLAISDLHFGNSLDRLDLVDRAFDYCAKNGINIILCGGDLIDGPYTKGEQRISDVTKQIEFFLNNYPHDRNILTFAAVGNHELEAEEKSSLYLPNICDEVRPDIIFGDRSNTRIDIKNDKISLQHKFNGTLYLQETAPLILYGHSHRYVIKCQDERLLIIIPSLSNVIQPKPSALDITISFLRGYISTIQIKQIYLEDIDYVASETNFTLKKNKNYPKTIPNNTEKYK